MSRPLSSAAQKFLEENGPFQTVHRLPHAELSGWSVRTPHGEDIALCDNEDVAFSISEVLNEALEMRSYD